MKLLSRPTRRVALLVTLLAAPLSAAPLELEDVLATVRRQYPPLLAAWMQQDFANGRVRQALGAFDPIVSATLALRPMNYYDGANAELMIEQPFSTWGGGVYGGYRISDGFLASYQRKIRTAEGGEAFLGVELPLLRDGDFDKRRAALGKAAVERELVNPFILKQYLDFHRAARITYFDWVAAGKRLAVAEELLRVAKERDDSLRQQAEEGALAEIVLVDNRRLVVSRELSVISARQKFEQAAIKLSLFHRDLQTGEPLIASRDQLPADFPPVRALDSLQLISDRGRAAFRRPESREIDLLIAKSKIDKRLARNNLKPNLDLAVELNQAVAGTVPDDIDETELTGFLKFSVPIGRNEAKGRIAAVETKIRQLEQKREFARDKIFADADNSFAALRAAYQAIERTALNMSLAEQLEAAEADRFDEGASDLLALQIREQSTFDARVTEIDAYFDYFKAMADYKAAVATDAPSHLLSSGRIGSTRSAR